MTSTEPMRGDEAVPTASPAPVAYCGHCGERRATAHERCDARLELEPPRYCPECRRRLIVQVLPTGYEARCSAHGALTPQSVPR